MFCVKHMTQKLYVQYDLNYNEVYVNMSREEKKIICNYTKVLTVVFFSLEK